MTTDELITVILESIEAGKKLKTIAAEQHYCNKQIERVLRTRFGVGYYTLFHLIYNPIVVHTIHSAPNITTAASLLNMSSQNLSNFIHRHMHTSPTIIKKEITMTKTEEKTMKEVLLILARQPNNKNVTLKELGLKNYNDIKRMRAAGLPIVSVPGKAGGYNLEKTSHDKCLMWVNNIRRSKQLEPLMVLY